MKIIKNASNVVLFAGETLELTAQQATNGDWVHTGTTTSNAMLVDNITDLPADWMGGHYIHPGWARTAEGEAAYQSARAAAVAALEAMATTAIQTLLDTTAQEHGYDHLERCISYRGSSVPLWDAQATRALAWRDACWLKAKDIQVTASAGNWPTAGAAQTPTVAEIVAAMPAAALPV